MKTISTTWPWEVCTVEQTVQHIKALNSDEVCFRASDGIYPQGMDDATRQRWQGKTYRELEAATKNAGLKVSIWCAAYLRHWAKEVEVIREAVQLYRPTAVFLDVENQEFVANIGPFLRALGRLPCPLYLQSFRRANNHPEMAWQKWYAYKDEVTGQYIIDGLGHQLYPLGWNTPEQWVDQFQKDIESHEKEIKAVGRPAMPWYPTLPTFVAGAVEGAPGWRPTPETFLAATNWLVQNLGQRLIGINFWCLDRHLAKMPDLYQTIANLKLPSVAPAPTLAPEAPAGITTLALAEWAQTVDAWARSQGYTGPTPEG